MAPSGTGDTVVTITEHLLMPLLSSTDEHLAAFRASWVAVLQPMPRNQRLYATLSLEGSSKTYSYDELVASNRWIYTLLYRTVLSYAYGGRSSVALAFVQDLLDLGLCPNAGVVKADKGGVVSVLDIFPERGMQTDPCRQALLLAGAVPRLHGEHLQWRRWHGRSARKLWVVTYITSCHPSCQQ
jgi:hypothetical protein